MGILEGIITFIIGYALGGLPMAFMLPSAIWVMN